MVYFTLEAKTKEKLSLSIKNTYKKYNPGSFGTIVERPKFNETKNCWQASGERFGSI